MIDGEITTFCGYSGELKIYHDSKKTLLRNKLEKILRYKTAEITVN